MAVLDRKQTIARIEVATARSRIAVFRTMSPRAFDSCFADTVGGRARVNIDVDRLIGVFFGRTGANEAAKRMDPGAE